MECATPRANSSKDRSLIEGLRPGQENTICALSMGLRRVWASESLEPLLFWEVLPLQRVWTFSLWFPSMSSFLYMLQPPWPLSTLPILSLLENNAFRQLFHHKIFNVNVRDNNNTQSKNVGWGGKVTMENLPKRKARTRDTPLFTINWRYWPENSGAHSWHCFLVPENISMSADQVISGSTMGIF